MIELDLLRFQDRLKSKKDQAQTYLWDPIRRKWIVSLPEELVRQLLLIYLLEELKFPPKLIQVEKVIKMNKMRRRFDVLLFDRTMKPHLLIECKRPDHGVNQAAFDQIARYNLALEVPYLLVSNGKVSFCCQMDYEGKSYRFLEAIPPLSAGQ